MRPLLLSVTAFVSLLLCGWILRVISKETSLPLAGREQLPAYELPPASAAGSAAGAGADDEFLDDGFDDPESERFEGFEPAPRTHVGPYNEYVPGRRYFIYSPSGGWNNQRECLENAVQIGVLLNRTVLVPMAGKHTQFWQGYHRLRSSRDLFPADRILDFPYLESYGVRLVPINVSVAHFVNGFVRKNGLNKILTIFHPERENWHKAEALTLLKESRPLIFLKGAEMYHHWFDSLTMTRLKQFVRYAPYLRQLSVRIANEALGKHFYAMHIRMGDYSARMGESAVTFLRTARAKSWKTRKYTTYVATEPAREEAYFAPLEQGMNVTFSTDLSPRLLEEFKSQFPPGPLRNDMLGLLEQLICVQADDFLGTGFSTFSAWIMFARKFNDKLLPEARAAAVAVGPQSG
jgi:hypothetical protein